MKLYKVYYNNLLAKLLLFPGFGTAMFFGFICTKRKTELMRSVMRHESTHVEQYMEMLYASLVPCLFAGIVLMSTGHIPGGILLTLLPLFFFYIVYFLEALLTLIVNLPKVRLKHALDRAYVYSMFEMEAVERETPVLRPEGGCERPRVSFAWLKYFGRMAPPKNNPKIKPGEGRG